MFQFSLLKNSTLLASIKAIMERGMDCKVRRFCYIYMFGFNNACALLFALFSQGGKAGAVQKCVACRGRGMRIMIRQLAPGMVQQMQSVCTDCNGEGNTSVNTMH